MLTSEIRHQAEWLLDTTRHTLVIRGLLKVSSDETVTKNHMTLILYSTYEQALFRLIQDLPVSLKLRLSNDCPTLGRVDGADQGVTEPIAEEVSLWETKWSPDWMSRRTVQMSQDTAYGPICLRSGADFYLRSGADFLPYLYRLHGIIAHRASGGHQWLAYEHFQRRLGGYLESQQNALNELQGKLRDFQLS